MLDTLSDQSLWADHYVREEVNPVAKKDIGDCEGEHGIENEFNWVDELGRDPDRLSELMMQFVEFLIQ